LEPCLISNSQFLQDAFHPPTHHETSPPIPVKQRSVPDACPLMCPAESANPFFAMHTALRDGKVTLIPKGQDV
jgi:hypothetical protein